MREINKSLQSYGFASGEIHGDMDQSSRIAELNRFKSGDINILVASDVAARGLDIKGVSHVFNFDTPWHPDDYVHRIGRTGRAGAKGRAFTFVTEEDAEAIANVEKLTESKIKPFGKEDVRVELIEGKPEAKQDKKAKGKPQRKDDDREDDRRSDEVDDRASGRNDDRQKPSRSRSPRKGDDKPDRGRGGGRRRDADDEVIPAGEWNGPKPDFLSVSAL